MVDLTIKNGDFPQLCQFTKGYFPGQEINLPEGNIIFVSTNGRNLGQQSAQGRSTLGKGKYMGKQWEWMRMVMILHTVRNPGQQYTWKR